MANGRSRTHETAQCQTCWKTYLWLKRQVQHQWRNTNHRPTKQDSSLSEMLGRLAIQSLLVQDLLKGT